MTPLNKKKLIFILLIFLTNSVFAFSANNQDDIKIEALLNSYKNFPLPEKISKLSEIFLNAPYLKEPLGEGQFGQFNQEPLYRFDRFDCETFVNTLLALSISNDISQFKKNIQRINYFDGEVSFQNRLHFVIPDWLDNLERLGILEDITGKITDNENLSTMQIYIDKKNWYRNLSLDRIKISFLSDKEKIKKLQQLHAFSKNIENEKITLHYLSLSYLFSHYHLFNQIPQSAIILLIANSPHIRTNIGTDIGVSHMGIIVWKNKIPFIRAASSGEKKVFDLPLIDYLIYNRQSQYIQGILLLALKLH